MNLNQNQIKPMQPESLVMTGIFIMVVVVIAIILYNITSSGFGNGELAFGNPESPSGILPGNESESFPPGNESESFPPGAGDSSNQDTIPNGTANTQKPDVETTTTQPTTATTQGLPTIQEPDATTTTQAATTTTQAATTTTQAPPAATLPPPTFFTFPPLIPIGPFISPPLVSDDPPPPPVLRAKSVGAGTNNTCAVLEDDPTTVDNPNTDAIENNEDGTVRCVGITTNNEMTEVPEIRTAAAVDSGSSHKCVLLADDPETADEDEGGTIRCWGSNLRGQLGHGSTNRGVENTPVKALGIETAVAMSVGFGHTCALLADDPETADEDEDGTIRCWGYNLYGQLGDHDLETDINIAIVGAAENSPVQVVGIDNAIAISAKNTHTCAVLEDGTVRCWGYNFYGQLGFEPKPIGSEFRTLQVSRIPFQIPGITTAIDVSVGIHHTCAVLEDGRVMCWGRNNHGQLGNGQSGDDEESATPVEVSEIGTARAISSWANYNCALLEDGSVSCWGDFPLGQVIEDSTLSSSTPVQISGILTAVAISLGEDHGCALQEDQIVWCWGDNSNNQLGYSPQRNSKNAPTTEAFITGNSALEVVAARDYTCAVLTTGNVACRGDNVASALGTGADLSPGVRDYQFRIQPNLVAGISTATALGNSVANHSCAVLADDATTTENEAGTIRCWGAGSLGQLGNGETSQQSTPVEVSNISNAIDAAAGSLFSCALVDDGANGDNTADDGVGTVWCWGRNRRGTLGNNMSGSSTNTSTPVQVIEGPSDPLTAVKGISAGANHACALLADNPDTALLDEDGTVSCWGLNNRYQIGTRPVLERGDTVAEDDYVLFYTTPVQIPDIDNAIQITSNLNHTCALLETERVMCWGQNLSGQIGNVAKARFDSEGETIVDNSLSLDDPDTVLLARFVIGPVQVRGVENAISVNAGAKHTCAVIDDGANGDNTADDGVGTVWCWGDNEHGQLGDGTGVNPDGVLHHQRRPVQVSGITTATAVSAGSSHTCALLNGGGVQCWGRNHRGQTAGEDIDEVYSTTALQFNYL